MDWWPAVMIAPLLSRVLPLGIKTILDFGLLFVVVGFVDILLPILL